MDSIGRAIWLVIVRFLVYFAAHVEGFLFQGSCNIVEARAKIVLILPIFTAVVILDNYRSTSLPMPKEVTLSLSFSNSFSTDDD